MGTSCWWLAQAAAGVLALFGIALVGWYGYTCRQASASRRWPTAVGTITEAEVQKSVEVIRSRMHRVFASRPEVYFVVVKYAYSVLGKPYEGYR
ncbi:MAG TPA: DUF3592 domain-containing protein [Chloroflexi bacterium]|nr:DUF3592 domain-containing protein [Chloroflexota bacterium]